MQGCAGYVHGVRRVCAWGAQGVLWGCGRLEERGNVVHRGGVLVVVGAVGVLKQLHLLLGHLQCLAVVATVEELVDLQP